MSYAILQRELEPLDVDRLKEAFQVLPILTSLDAQTAAREAFGILMRGLDIEEASQLQGALTKASIDTEVIEESELPVIPPAKLVRQMEFLAEHVTLYDPMGRSYPLPWQEVHVIAAGRVKLPPSKRPRSGIEAHIPHDHPADHVQVAHDSHVTDAYHLMLDIVLPGGVGRYSLMADEFEFTHLGTRLTEDITRNFCMLVEDLSECAGHAGLNRGANLICQRTPDLFAYPSKAAFLQETTWILWRIRQASR